MPARPSGRNSVKMKMYGEEDFTSVTAAAAIYFLINIKANKLITI
jgi:hypothetical protein